MSDESLMFFFFYLFFWARAFIFFGFGLFGIMYVGNRKGGGERGKDIYKEKDIITACSRFRLS